MNWIEQHGHGGDIWTAAARFQIDPTRILDYSANINPLGPPEGLQAVLQAAFPQIARYPDPSCRHLRAKLAKQLNVSGEQLLIGNGAAECIQLAVSALQPKRVGIIYPCFSEYEAAAKKAGCEIVSVYTSEENQFLPTWSQLVELMEQVDLLFIGHPNNPTGNCLSWEMLRKLADYCEQAEVYLCIDEAFIDFLPDGEDRSLLNEIYRCRFLLIFRSLTKMYAIAGLRLGYVVGTRETIEQLASGQIPWSVNHFAQVAGEWLLEQNEFVRMTQQFISGQRSFLTKELALLPEVRLFAGKANYILLHVAGITSLELQQEMAQRGVLIRNCSMYPGLGEGYIRLAIKGEADNRTMLSVLRESLVVLQSRERGNRL